MAESTAFRTCFRWLACCVAWALINPLHAEERAAAAGPSRRPNIVWIIAEDMSPHFGCYGDTSIRTPRIDQMAAEGTRFERAFVTAPICSISRSALITGRYQTSIGAHHHRSGRGDIKIHLPADTPLVPALFQAAGYWTANGSWPMKNAPAKNAAGKKTPGKKALAKNLPIQNAIGKTDYNFEWDAAIYDGVDWQGRRAEQPFFAQIQLHGGKVRDGKNADAIFTAALGQLTDPADLPLPPYYPRTPEILKDWAQTLDACRYTDLQVGEVLDRLRADGLLDSTVVFFITDHGVSHARGKQFLYDEGTRIPCIVRGPGIEAGKVRRDLIEHIDLAATSLALAGIERPATMSARDVLAGDYRPRDATFAARDRADETVDRLRSVRTERWKYIRNFYPLRPHLQPNNYKDHKPCLIALRAARDAGLLDEIQSRLFAATRPAEELYDLEQDPWEIHNLAADPGHAETLATLRARLEQWMVDTNDQGRQPETAAQYDSDMAAYLGGKTPGRNPEIERNIAWMKEQAAAGR